MTRQRIRNEQISAETIAANRLAKGDAAELVAADRAAHLSDGEQRAAKGSTSSSAPAKRKRAPKKPRRR